MTTTASTGRTATPAATAIDETLTFDRWMPMLARALPEPLITPDALDRISRFCRRVPARELGGIEIRLAEGPTPADFAFRLTDPRQIDPVLAWLEPEYNRAFVRHWAAESDPRMPFICLEFDLESGDPETLDHPVSIVKLKRRRDSIWITDTLIPALRGGPMPEAQRRLVRHCLEQVPAPGKPTYLFDLQSRGLSAIRLDFIRLEPETMEAFMLRLDRPDLARTAREAAALLADAERLHFSFDVDDEIGDRLGMEASFLGWPGGDDRWQVLLDRLVDAGLSCPAKRDLALAWPGHDNIGTAGDLWPDEAPIDSHLVRFTSHVKLACRPGQPPEAKIYLLFGHYLRNDAGNLRLRSL